MKRSKKPPPWNDRSWNDPKPMEFFLRTIRDAPVPAGYQAKLKWVDVSQPRDGRQWLLWEL